MAAFSKQFDSTSLRVSPYDLAFALDVLALYMWQGHGNNFSHRQIFRSFYKQAIPTEIFQPAFIEPIFCNEEYIA